MNLVNFRCLGGIPAKGGKKVKAKKLLRSAEPVALNDEAVAMLTAHNLKTIVDFRAALEAENSPVNAFDGVRYLNYDVMAEADDGVTANPDEWMKKLNPDTAGEMIRGLYRAFALTESGRTGYAKFIRDCISTTDGAVLFHCAAGKDRTGVGAAIVLRLLGVEDDAILQDYLESNTGRKDANEQMFEQYRQKGFSDTQLNAMKRLMAVDSEWLKSALFALDAEYGSFDKYVEEGLGLTSSEVDELRSLYLE